MVNTEVCKGGFNLRGVTAILTGYDVAQRKMPSPDRIASIPEQKTMAIDSILKKRSFILRNASIPMPTPTNIAGARDTAVTTSGMSISPAMKRPNSVNREAKRKYAARLG